MFVDLYHTAVALSTYYTLGVIPSTVSKCLRCGQCASASVSILARDATYGLDRPSSYAVLTAVLPCVHWCSATCLLREQRKHGDFSWALSAET